LRQAQLAVISKTLQALSKKQNALLESPTGIKIVNMACLTLSSGTGKTLALLTSTLSWQKKEKLLSSKNLRTSIEQLCSSSLPHSPLSLGVASNELESSIQKHQIYFCSRTHSQLQQVNQLTHYSSLSFLSLLFCSVSDNVRRSLS
jgi:Rad3-related DNA helicase